MSQTIFNPRKVSLLLAYFNSQTTEFHTGAKQPFQSMQERKQSFHFLPHSANQSIHDQIPAKNSRYTCAWIERSFHSRTTFASLFPFANEPTVQPQPTDLLVKAEPSKVPDQSGPDSNFDFATDRLFRSIVRFATALLQQTLRHILFLMTK